MVSARNVWYNDPRFVYKNTTKKPGEGGGGYFQKNWVEVCDTRPETLTLFQTKICDFPYPISLLKPWSPARQPRPQGAFPWPKAREKRPGDEVARRVTSCYGTYTVGVTLKGKWSYRQMMKK